jgi:hypothetical protein
MGQIIGFGRARLTVAVFQYAGAIHRASETIRKHAEQHGDARQQEYR